MKSAETATGRRRVVISNFRRCIAMLDRILRQYKSHNQTITTMEQRHQENHGFRRRKLASIVPPELGEQSLRCCRNISNSSANGLSNSSIHNGKNSPEKDSASSKASSDNIQKENKTAQKCSVTSNGSLFIKCSSHKPKSSGSWRPTRKTQRSMSAHSVAIPGPDSAVLRDPLTEKIYKRGKILGKGGFAKVYEGVEVRTGKRYALKIIDKTKVAMPPQREKVDAEIDLHAAASESDHPNVTKFEGSFENARIICLVLELCSKRSLAQYLRRKEFLQESEVSDIVWQIVCGLTHIHGCGLIHRDLKLGNILLSDDMTVKIADFGLATRTSWGKRRTICGTPNFIAPEVLNRHGHGPEADLWAVGCILYTLLVGKPPFDCGSMKDTYKSILKNSYQIPSFVSEEASDLVRRLLQAKPQARPTLRDVLNHSFFVKNETAARLPGIEVLSLEHPHREIVSAPVIPLRRRSALPRTKLQDHLSGSGSESCQLRHGNCLSDPCLVTSAAKYNENQNSSPLNTTIEKSAENRVSSEDGVSSLVKDADTEKETRDTVNEADNTRTEDNNNHSNKGRNEISRKSYKMSPMKLLASKLQKIKVPSPIRSKKTATQKKAAPEPVQVPLQVVTNTNEATWITKWVDYSNKYGFGYQLATGEIGVLFNDGSHIMLLRDGSTVELIDADWKTAEDSKVFPISSPPPGCLRTVNILRLFINYMDQNLKAQAKTSSPSSPLQSTVRMLTWSRTNNHVVMYLTNGTLQVNFADDHAKVNVSNIHNKSSMIVSYVNKDKDSFVYNGNEIMNIRIEELRHRLRQVHEEFHYLLGELECVSHPFCNIFQETSDVDPSQDYQETPVAMVAAR